jgi:PAS domain S-box-containing protein
MSRFLFGLLILLSLVGMARAELTPVTLQLKWRHQFQFAGYYAALEQGYYRDAGLAVRIVEGAPGLDPVDRVVAGAVDFGVYNSSLLLRRHEGQPVTALAAIVQHSPLAILARKDRGIERLADLKGRRVMIYSPDAGELYAYLLKSGVRKEDLVLEPHTMSPLDLVSGRVDAQSIYVTDQPYLLRQAGVSVTEFRPIHGGIDFYGDLLFTSERMLQDYPDRVRAFREASLKGWAYALSHIGEMADLIHSKYTPDRSREHLLFEAEHYVHLIMADLVELGHMSPSRWRHIADTYAELGMLPARYDFSGLLYDPKPLDLRQYTPWLVAVLALLLVLGAFTVHAVRGREALRRAYNQRESLVVAAPGVMFQYLLHADGSSCLPYTAPSFPELFGLEGQAVRRDASPLFARIHPEDFPRLLRLRDRSAAQLDLFTHECRYLHPTRGEMWIEAKAMPERLSNGETLWHGFFSDGTGRYRALAALSESEVKFRGLYELAPVGITLTDFSNGDFLDANQAFLDLAGYSREELLGLTYWAMTPPEYEAQEREQMESLLGAGRYGPYRKEYRRRDGTRYPVMLNGIRIHDEQGRDVVWSIVQDLTEQDRATQELARQRALYQDVVACQPSGVYRLRVRPEAVVQSANWQDAALSPYRIEFLSDRFCEIVGVDRESLMADPATIRERIHPEDRESWRQVHRDANATLTTAVWEGRLVAGEGSRWVHFEAVPRTMETGEVMWTGIVYDITAAKRTEALIAASEERFRGLYENAPVAYHSLDAQGRFLEVNDRLCELTGYRRETLLACPFQDLLADPDMFDAVFSSLLARNRCSTEVRLRIHDDEQVTVLLEGRVQRDADGLFLRAHCVLYDITARKLAEQLLNRYRFIVNAVQDLMTVVGPDRRYEAVNDAWCHALNRSRESVIGRRLADIWGEEVYRDAIAQRLDRCLAADEAVVLRASVQFPLTGLRECDISYLPYHDPDTDETHVVIITRDVTEKVKAERDMLFAMEAAEKASRAKSAFLAHMSHELRTPLNAIIGFAQLLDMGVPAPLAETQREAVGHILSGGRHLLGLIGEVLDLSRIEAGRLELNLEPVLLRPLFHEAITLVQPAAGQRHILVQECACPRMHAHAQSLGTTVVHTDCPSAAAVMADPQRVRQVLLNLLSNAVKYNRDGGSVNVECLCLGDRIRVLVTDTGRGIPRDRYADLFDPFNRLGAENSRVEGAGIGLAIAKQLVEAMGGAMGFESEPDRGSTFWFELAYARYAQPQVFPAAPAKSVVGTLARIEAPARRGQVVYVEDNPANVTVMRHVFKQIPGADLISAEDAETGLERIRELHPDLVLMDIDLPGMNGLEALRVMRADPALADIPVVAVSAAAMSRDVEAGMAAGFRAYLTKPFDVPELIRLVKEALKL